MLSGTRRYNHVYSVLSAAASRKPGPSCYLHLKRSHPRDFEASQRKFLNRLAAAQRFFQPACTETEDKEKVADMNTMYMMTAALLLAIFAQASTGVEIGAASGGPPRTEIRLAGDGWKLWRDVEAQWEDDELFLPPVDVSKLPVHPPTGGWAAIYAEKTAIPVSVPGTVEEYFWDKIQGEQKTKQSSTLGDYLGVSWWWRTVEIPASAKGKRCFVKFENNWLRSEVFINETLVGYDLVGHSVFEVDITDAIKPGEINTLAVRITDAGGNFIWPDVHCLDWGKYKIPLAHGFGGIAGNVDIRMVDPVSIDNVFIKNLPEMTSIDVKTAVQNVTGDPVTGTLQIDLVSVDDPQTVVFSQRYENIALKKGLTQVEHRVSVPSANLWHYDSPNLYIATVRLEAKDYVDQDATRFGFRWFDISERGVDDHFVLNGKREFLLSAISWGFWPVNGVTPTEDLAEKQIRQAKGLGMNMLNFHRHKGQSMVLDKADELGLLYYAEPGGYRAQGGDEFSFEIARLKWFRMIKEFRNHPSLVIYNMINEMGEPPVTRHTQDMLNAHAIDPTRIFTYSSGFHANNIPCRLHMLPYDDTQHAFGWFDPHHACSIGVYRDGLYNSPTDYSYRYDESKRKEVLFLGEEGALSAPPRLRLINEYYTTAGNRNGWDGADYVQWFDGFDGYLKRKGLKHLTVDDVTTGIGDIQYYYHGRMIENAKINDLVDGYCINGWECEKLENHSGIVDSFRSYKGNPDNLLRYTRPVYVAIKARNKVTHVGEMINVDFFIVNGGEKLHGDYTLAVDLVDPAGTVVKKESWPVSVSRDRLGTLVKENIGFALEGSHGYYTLNARLVDPDGAQQADGVEKLYTVDWKSAKLPSKGAIIEPARHIRNLLSAEFTTDLPTYQDDMGKLDYIFVENSVSAIPDRVFQTLDGKPGLKAEYYNQADPKTVIGSRIEPNIQKGDPIKVKGLGREIFVVWTGTITLEESASYIFCGEFAGHLRIWLDGKELLNKRQGTRRKTAFISSDPVEFKAGKPYDLKVEHVQDKVGGRNHALVLFWQRSLPKRQYDQILERIANDGTTLIVSGNETFQFAEELDRRGLVKYHGRMVVERWWKAGAFFTVEHPLVKGLPQNTGMNWEYQDIARYEMTIDSAGEFQQEFEGKRYGLLLEGEEVAVFCTNGHQFEVASAVSVVRHGKGKIVLSCLDLYPYLGDDSKSANSIKKILCNYIEYGTDAGTTAR